MDHEAALAPSGPSTHTHDHVVPAEGGALDPVCGMTVDTHTAKHRADYRGQPYYFCSTGCKTKFTADPQKYLSKQEKAAEPIAEGLEVPWQYFRVTPRLLLPSRDAP